MHILLHLAVLTVTVLALTRFIPSVKVKSVGSAILVAIVFSVLDVLLSGFIRALLFVPGILSFGLLFFFVTLIVNTVLLWLTDKLLGSFEIGTFGGLVTSAAILTAVNWAFVRFAGGSHMVVIHGPGPTRWI